jgi:outer membrane protein insertion porin family
VNAQAVFNRRTEDYKFPEYLFSLGFREPYLANWPVTFTSNLTLFRRQFPSFDADVSRITLGFRRELSPGIWGFVEYNFERNKISDVQYPYIKATDERTDIIGSITPGFSIDSRDDRFNPTKGVNSTQSLEIASNFLGSQDRVGFYRFTSYNSAYFRLFDNVVLALAANLGWERSNVENAPIPTFKLFRLGGINSVRGYREDAIEVETSKLVKGTLALVNYRAELRIPVVGSFGTALFLDAGNLLIDRFSFNPALLKSSVGAGLRYVTPVGPVVLDFAWRLQTENPAPVKEGQLPDNDRFRVHFAIGAF